ncbi:DUF2249 domain-containing protein [Propionimicrobium sp. PCR01-08-3]|uniref:DUF2249 domain-containing protein n=1 Tax=Propionimicrobium sp. PCR01-08-3 TaxID=3052086 RepID=UPI00255CF73D|nr:DUF2249 domain-containing protein [Propionimicrobium sp. PCR01-08-3]WIY82970.1 DUF2249 domain-containing protein [Propionimicrobium sp. PCR01-08-3]
MTQQIPLTETTTQHSCGCGCEPVSDYELDARQIPHAIRHGAILGALASLEVGSAMLLIAPHDPKPLLAQISDLFGEAIETSYVDRAGDGVGVRLLKTHATN